MEKEQIIKALEVCSNYKGFGDCDKCPAREGCDTENSFLEKTALSLILEQEKRIEELEKECALWEEEADNAIDIAEGNIRAEIASGGTCCHWCEDKIKADTMRNMQEAIKERCIKGGIYSVFVESVVDNVARDMLEGD